MTLINLIRRQIGLMPFSYSFYKARGLYLLTFKGYKTGIACPSLRQLKEQAWGQYYARIDDGKSRQQPAGDLASDLPAAKTAAVHKAYIA